MNNVNEIKNLCEQFGLEIHSIVDTNTGEIIYSI